MSQEMQDAEVNEGANFFEGDQVLEQILNDYAESDDSDSSISYESSALLGGPLVNPPLLQQGATNELPTQCTQGLPGNPSRSGALLSKRPI